MSYFDSGVTSYIRAKATVTVNFPVDHRGNADINCVQCQFFRDTSRRCGLTGMISQYPTKYVGDSCPLEIIDEEVNFGTEIQATPG